MSLRAENVSLKYGDGDHVVYAVREVNLTLPERGFFGIMGPSGSGKSSLLYLLSGLKPPSEGAIYYKDRVLSRIPENECAIVRRQKFGFVFQQPFLLNYLTARENVLTAASEGDREAIKRAGELLGELGIAHLAERYPAHLSGGEKQRVAVARAMMNRPEIIFADEPTAALDHTNGHAVITLLSRYRDRGAVIVVTHDPEMVSEAERVYRLRDGLLEGVDERRLASR